MKFQLMLNVVLVLLLTVLADKSHSQLQASIPLQQNGDFQVVAYYRFPNDSMLVLLNGNLDRRLTLCTISPSHEVRGTHEITLPSSKHFAKAIIPVSGKQFRVVGSVLDASGSRIFHTLYNNFLPIRTLEIELPQNALVNKLKQLPTGDYVLCGAVYDNSVSSKDGLIACLSQDWQIIWFKTFGGPGEDELLDISVSPGGNIVAVGRLTHQQHSTPWSVFINPLGENAVENISQLPWPGKLSSVASFEGGFLAAGEIDKGSLFGKDSYVQCLDPAGQFVSEKSSAIKGDDLAHDVVFGLDGFYYVTGTRADGGGNIHPYLWKYATNGDKLFGQTLRELPPPVTPLNLLQFADGSQALLHSGNSPKNSANLHILSGEIIDYAGLPVSAEFTLSNLGGNGQLTPFDQANLNVQLEYNGNYYLRNSILQIFTVPPVSTVKLEPKSSLVTLKPKSSLNVTVKVETRGTPPNSTFSIAAALFSPRGDSMLQKEIPISIVKPENLPLRITRFEFRNLTDPSAPVNTLFPGDSAKISFTVKNESLTPLPSLLANMSTNSNYLNILNINKQNQKVRLQPSEQATFQFQLSASPLLTAPEEAELVVSLAHPYSTAPQEQRTYVKLQPEKEQIAQSPANSPSISEDIKTVPLDFDLPASESEAPEAFAVIIGNRNYVKAKSVDFAHADAEAVRDLCITSLGIRPGNIFLLKDATKAQFEIYFGNRNNPRGKLANVIIPDKSDVFIYYSGHGAPGLKDKKGYLVPSDCDPQFLEVTGYPLETLYENLAQLPARNITLVIDACFSGEDVHNNISPLLPLVSTPILSKPNIAVINSSSGTQYSTWFPEKGHSLFTYFFLKAFGSPETDTNSDGNLSVEEIFQFVSHPTNGVPYWARRLHNAEQTPELIGQNKNYLLYRSKP